MSLGLDDLKKAPRKTELSAKKAASVKKVPAARPWSPSDLAAEADCKKIYIATQEEVEISGLYDLDETVTRSAGRAGDNASMVFRLFAHIEKAEAVVRDQCKRLCKIKNKFVGRRGQ